MAILRFLALSSLLASSLWAQEPPPRPVAELLADLGAPEFETRERASRELIARGREVRAALEQALDAADLETRLRIEAILADLPVETQLRTTSLEPHRIDLNAVDRSLGEIIREIEDRSPARFRRPLGLPESRVLSIVMDDMPLLQALDKVALALGSRWYRDYGTDLLRFTPNPGARPLCRYFGPLRVSFNGVSRNRTLTFGLDPSDRCLLQGQIDLEPGCEVLGVWSPPEITSLRDDQGRDLLAEQAPTTQFNSARDRKNFNFSIAFAPPADDARAIGSLKGSFRLAIGTRYQTLDLDLGRARRLREGQVEVAVVSEQERGTERLLVVEIRREPVSVSGSAARTVVDETVTLFDERGETIEPLARPMAGSRAGAATLTFRLGADRRAVRLRATVLRECRAETIDFEFADLPLP